MRPVIQRMRWGVVGALALGLLSAWAGPTQAVEGRYTTLFDEHLDGKKQATSSAELVVIKELLAAGVHFIDEAQSRQIRSVTDAGQLIGGTVNPVITSLDADVIVAGICHLHEVKSDLLGPNAHRYDASIEARAISVATGEVIGVYLAQGEAMAFVAQQAARQAAGVAAKDLARQILETARKPRAAPRIELTITGIPNISAGERVRKAVESLEGVSKLTVAQAGRGISKLVIETQGQAARDIALAIDGAKGLGVSVFGYSDRAIKAEYRIEAAMALQVLLAEWSNASRRKRDAWQSKALAGVVGTSLSNLSFLRFPAGMEAQALGEGPRSWKKGLRKLKVAPNQSLVVTGSFQRAGANVTVQTSIRAAKTGAVVLAGQRSCPVDEVSGCTADLADDLADKLLASVQEKRHLFKAGLEIQGAGTGAEKPVQIVSVEADNIFPARMGAYSREAVGHLVVKNTGTDVVTGVVLNADLPGYTRAPVDYESEDIAPGAEARIPIRLVLNEEVMAAHQENQPAVLALILTYVADDYRIMEKRSQAVVVYDRNTVSWMEPDSVAAFVTPRSSNVQAIAREVSGALPKGSLQHPLARPAGLYSAFTQQGLRYVKDPVNPHAEEALDYVQFPEQTLESRAGDCDDLAVLYVSLSEAMGHPALLVTTPGHIFTALSTGLPAQSATTITFDKDALLEHGGKLWVPVETTLVDKTFSEAWKAGVTELARWKAEPDKIRVIDLRAAWATYPTVDLAPPARRVRKVADPAVVSDVTTALGAADHARSSFLDGRLAEVNQRIAEVGEKAELLNEKGQILYHQGNVAEARALFERAANDKQWGKIARNNLGNLDMVEGHPAKALVTYREAAEMDEGDHRVQMNAALAAFAAGDEDAFGEHVFNCIDLGAEAAVTQLSQSGFTVSPGTTGADAEGIAMRELQRALQRAYKRAGRTMPAAAKQSGTKASQAGGTKVPVHRYLYWL